MSNYWFKVPMSVFEDNDDDHNKVLAEIYLRMLGHRNGGDITTSMNKIAQYLQWDDQKLYKFAVKLTKRGVLGRKQTGNNGRKTGNYFVCGTTTYADKKKRTGSKPETFGKPYIIEKERKKREGFLISEDEDKKREEYEKKLKLKTFGGLNG